MPVPQPLAFHNPLPRILRTTAMAWGLAAAVCRPQDILENDTENGCAP